nr:MAG TPA: hypothetical protein [Caudoviricetes sp.]
MERWKTCRVGVSCFVCVIFEVSIKTTQKRSD